MCAYKKYAKMKKVKTLSAARSSGAEPRRAHRVRVLIALRAICVQIGRLQRSAEGRLACREVARMLELWLARDTPSRQRRKE